MPWIALRLETLDALKQLAEEGGNSLVSKTLPIAGEPGWVDVEVDSAVAMALKQLSPFADEAVWLLIEGRTTKQ